MPNTRELASLILFAGLVAVVLAVPKWRRGVLPSGQAVARAFFQWPIIRIFALFILWSALWIWLASRVRLWEPALLTETVVLLFGVGFPLLFSSIRAKSGADIFRQIRRETLTLSAVFVFYLNLVSTALENWTVAAHEK